MFAIKKKDQDPIDFCQIVGSCTPEARKQGAEWDNVNVANKVDRRGQELVSYFIDFHRQLLNKEHMQGLLEPSASDCNQLALRLARDYTGKNKVLCSNLSHKSIADACHTLRLEPIVLDAIPQNRFQVPEEAIAAAISTHGKDLAAVVSTYGTTQLGNIEQLANNPLVQQLRHDGVWLHVDAAYGSYIGHLSSLVSQPIPESDSLTIDQYKFIGKPGVALLMADQNKIPKNQVSYYVHSHCTNHTTLSAGPIAAWAQTFRDCGEVAGLRELADEYVMIARHAAANLQLRGVHLICSPELAIVPVSLGTLEKTESVHDSLMQMGFSVGKVDIKGSDYEMHGIRIVYTPKINPYQMIGSSRKLCCMIEGLYHRN